MLTHTLPLPEAVLAEEVHMAADARAWSVLCEGLRRDAPNEACAFVLARPSRGERRVTVLLGEILWPAPGDVRASPFNLEISAEYVTRAMDAAADAGDFVGVVLIHTHPASDLGPGKAHFSPRDDWYEARLFPTITLDRPGALSGSIVLGSDPGDVDARVWWNDGGDLRTARAHAIRVVGPELQIVETPSSKWTEHPDPSMMDRSTRLWGAHGRRVLQNLRVGVVGAGGTGSVVLASLATMGVGKIDVWDADVVKSENLHRMLGSTSAMRGKNKATALAGWLRQVATAEPFAITDYDQWATTSEGMRRLKDCDVIFCCVDRFAPRVPLNDIAYAHLIPTIDMASWLHATGGVVDAVMTHAHVWAPGIPCAWCRGTLTSRRLTREAQGHQRDAERRIPYGLPLADTDGVEPSVLPVNIVGAGLALMQFMQVALHITERTPRDLKLILPEWELDESDLNTLPGCATEGDIALGDQSRISPVES